MSCDSLDSTSAPAAFGEDGQHEPFTTEHPAAHIDPAEPLSPEDAAFQRVSDVLNRIVLWLGESKDVHSAGIRAFALVAITRPEILDASHSQTDLAAALGISRQALSKRVRELFDLGNGNFRRATWMHGSAVRAAYQKRALEVHQRHKENHDQ